LSTPVPVITDLFAGTSVPRMAPYKWTFTAENSDGGETQATTEHRWTYIWTASHSSTHDWVITDPRNSASVDRTTKAKHSAESWICDDYGAFTLDLTIKNSARESGNATQFSSSAMVSDSRTYKYYASAALGGSNSNSGDTTSSELLWDDAAMGTIATYLTAADARGVSVRKGSGTANIAATATATLGHGRNNWRLTTHGTGNKPIINGLATSASPNTNMIRARGPTENFCLEGFEITQSGYAGVAVSSVTYDASTGMAVVTTSSAHGLSNGASITMSGCADSKYNITNAIGSLGATSFRYWLNGVSAPTSPDVGTPSYTVVRSRNAITLYTFGSVSGSLKVTNGIIRNNDIHDVKTAINTTVPTSPTTAFDRPYAICFYGNNCYNNNAYESFFQGEYLHEYAVSGTRSDNESVDRGPMNGSVADCCTFDYSNIYNLTSNPGHLGKASYRRQGGTRNRVCRSKLLGGAIETPWFNSGSTANVSRFHIIEECYITFDGPFGFQYGGPDSPNAVDAQYCAFRNNVVNMAGSSSVGPPWAITVVAATSAVSGAGAPKTLDVYNNTILADNDRVFQNTNAASSGIEVKQNIFTLGASPRSNQFYLGGTGPTTFADNVYGLASASTVIARANSTNMSYTTWAALWTGEQRESLLTTGNIASPDYIPDGDQFTSIPGRTALPGVYYDYNGSVRAANDTYAGAGDGTTPVVPPSAARVDDKLALFAGMISGF
jgi:hypothetical protein